MDAAEPLRRTADNDVRFEAMFEKFMPSNDHVEIVRKLFSTADDAVPYSDEHIEICHFIQTICTISGALKTEDLLDKQVARILVFNNFRAYWERHVDGGECEFEKEFAFPLVAKIVDPDGNVKEYRQYRPRPDVAFYKHGFPRFIADFESSDDKQDLNRLYVQMACSLRLGLGLREETSSNDSTFFLMGALFTQQWTIHRIFAYTGENGNVKIHTQVFQMNSASEFLSFLLEFYNYARHVKDDSKLDKEAIAALGQEINEKYTQKLLSEGGYLPKSSQNGTDQDTKRSSNVDGRAAMVDVLKTSNYVVHYQYFDDEFEPLVKLPDHMIEAKSPDGTLVLAKLVHKTSDELSFLRVLGSRKSPHNHVIPLLATIQSSSGPVLIFPQSTALSTNFMSLFFKDELKSDVWHMSRQLIEGIAFLHRQKIAHLDIKPENLVYSSKSKHLYIIDFDLAVRCKNVEEMVKFSCGTRGWSAPEIVLDDNKPARAFSPIRADLWSCGRVLRFLADVAHEKEKDGVIMLLADSLMDTEPRRRPLLHEVVDEEPDFWTSGRLVHALESQVGSDKFKRLRWKHLS